MSASASPAVSPPRTPDIHPVQKSRPSSATPSDDSSIIDDLSFEYVVDDHGNYVRLSKGSSKSNNSSPPTPLESHLQPDSLPLPSQKPPSPILLNSPVRRGSLSRSESAYSVLTGAADRPPARSFQRVASGPVLLATTPGTSSTASKPRSLPRRVTMEDNRDPDQRGRKQPDARALDALQDEKENILGDPDGILASKRHSPPLSARSTSASSSRQVSSRPPYSTGGRPLADVPLPQRAHARQILPAANRAGRIVKNGSTPKLAVGSGFGRISEIEGSESEGHEFYAGEETDTGDDEPLEPALPPSASQPNGSLAARQRSHAALPSATSLVQSTTTRPRRSASLSDASSHDDFVLSTVTSQNQNQNHRPGTSQGFSNNNGESGARRVALEERERQGVDVRGDYKKYRREAEDAERRAQAEQDQHIPRQSPSPTHNQSQPSTLRLAHKRRDSDTLRSVPSLAPSSSPTAVEPSRLSPSLRGLTREAAAAAKHRRSPTAPDPSTLKTWGDREDDYGVSGSERERERDKDRRGHHQMSMQQQQQQYMAPSVPASVPAPPPSQLNRNMVVNRKAYARLDMIGKGGSSRVFRVMNHANELYAIKRVTLDKTDAETMNGYMNEIALLKRLDGNSRIIRLIDSEVKPGPGGSKGHLLLVMECGEIDLARLLSEQQKEPMNMVWVSYYWQQMLQAVHVIHEEKIVHSDLKPANFVLVRGQLKLIDFGIANAIANDTTNIQRDHQIGTVNYMSPEAIELPDGMRRLKVGRPSDVWSLGCILYQMVYGHPPFQHLSMYQKMKAIPDLTHVIEFPEYSTPSIPTRSSSQGSTTPPKKLDHLKRKVRRDVIASMKSCLCRPPKERAMIPELMEQDWLAMKEPEPPAMKDMLAADETVINPYYMRQLLQYGIKLGETQTPDMGPEALLREAERLVAELKSIQP